jgi:processive 1,2-diacylglycerol beta-glucosyltransferase
MIELYDAESDTLLGTLTDEQFQSLADSLEEESTTDQDYYIDSATVDMLDEESADPDLVALLRKALAGRDGMDIRWERG